MDAVEFIKQLRRMDEKGVLKNRFIYPCTGRATDSPEDVVAEVEEWAKMNPVKTRQSVFLEQWPEAELYPDGVLGLCPKKVSVAYRNGNSCAKTIACGDCCRKFWMQEVE
jgi:hypothetical protein